VLAAFAVSLPEASASGYTFTPIVVPEATLTVAFGINNFGEMIVGEYGCCVGTSANSAFLLSSGTLTMLPNVPGSDATNATAINDSGDIVGTYLIGGASSVDFSFRAAPSLR